MRTYLKKFVWLYLLIAGACAHATQLDSQLQTNIVSEIAFCNQADLDFTQATQCEYQTQKINSHFSFTDKQTWIRLRIKSATAPMPSVALHIGPHFLTDIQLFEKIAGRWHKHVAGSHLSGKDYHAEIGGYSFILQSQSTKENTYYLRVNTMSLTKIFIVTEPWPTSDPYNHKLGIGMQFGALLLILAFSLVSYALHPNVVMGRFSLLMLTTALTLAAGSGVLSHFVLSDWPTLNHHLFTWLISLRLAFWIGLSQALLAPYQTPNWYLVSCRITYAVVAIGMLMITVNLHAIAYSFILAIMLIAPIAQIIAIYQTPNIEKVFRRAFVSGFLIYTLLVLIAVLTVNYSPTGSYLPMFVTRMTDFAAPLVMLSIIAFQQRMKNLELNQVKIALAENSLRGKFEQKLLAERKLLIDMITHELKNPLTTISMATGSLSHDLKKLGLTENRRLENIKHSIANMDSIIERCTLMNSVDHMQQAFTSEQVDLRSLLNQCIKQCSERSRIHLAVAEGLSLKADGYLLAMAVNNLISNALKYSLSSSPINIKVERQKMANQASILISVKNSISPALAPDEDALFRRYYRHPLALETSGSGLGLYLTQGICELLGAKISYKRKEQDVTFTIEVPA